MNKPKGIFNLANKVSSIFMLLALAWLTISLPFVFEDQLNLKELTSKADIIPSPEEDTNPLTGTTEEKTEGGVNNLSEYLHDLHLVAQHSSLIIKFYKCHPSDLYFEFHPELISPPPEA